MEELTNQLMNRLWNDYITQNPHAKRIYDLLELEGETIVNDHIAFRTFNIAHVDISALEQPFLRMGYVHGGDYIFEEKKLVAKHYSIPQLPQLPKIFISMLQIEKCSKFLQETAHTLFTNIPKQLIGTTELLYAGNQWGTPNYSIYNQLKTESEYAAWLYVNGFKANHFTVSVNALKKYNDIRLLNKFIKANGFEMNTVNGEVKGSPSQLLEQSSIMAGKEQVQFEEGGYSIPRCYYEFAKRYPDDSGKLYDGFIAQSANTIFESTNG